MSWPHTKTLVVFNIWIFNRSVKILITKHKVSTITPPFFRKTKDSCKIEVRHILFKKICFLIFLNNQLTAYYTITYCLKRKNKKRFFSFQSMPNLNFAELIRKTTKIPPAKWPQIHRCPTVRAHNQPYLYQINPFPVK